MKTNKQPKRTSKSLFVVPVYFATALAVHAQPGTNAPPQFWTPFSGEWGLLDGQMVTQTSGQENWVWAGLPPIVTQGDFDAELKLEFTNIPGATNPYTNALSREQRLFRLAK